MSDDYADFGERPTLDDSAIPQMRATVVIGYIDQHGEMTIGPLADPDRRVVPHSWLVAMRGLLFEFWKGERLGSAKEMAMFDAIQTIDALIASTGGDAT